PEHPWEAYREALVQELAYWATQPQFAGRRFATLFFGGGTPSLAPPELVAEVVEQARCLFGFEPRVEITLESNPGTVDAGHFAGYRAAGVNRLSIGIQSLDNAELRWLERIHDANEAIRAYETARAAGFDNINLDLMYGLPEQTAERWTRSLEQAIALGPEHLSCYQLTIEPHTLLASRHAKSPLPMPGEETGLTLFRSVRNRLAAAGFEAYEISNFAHPGLHCRHNDGYWLYRDYIGIGAGAAGKWDEGNGGVVRYTNTRSPEQYMGRIGISGCAIQHDECLDLHRAAAEAAWLGMRRRAGIGRSDFLDRFSRDVWEMFATELQPWRDTGHLELTDAHLRLSDRGLALTDAIATSVI
ncbi:MAG TPA: radical SAM family heme chaperone HemW, partial [Mariprofundaceae bacterium]|nr:radical SAM family heme chaperone HemW [Mariprofundaceae bacterium]